jgi:hypothetical protein
VPCARTLFTPFHDVDALGNSTLFMTALDQPPFGILEFFANSLIGFFFINSQIEKAAQVALARRSAAVPISVRSCCRCL